MRKVWGTLGGLMIAIIIVLVLEIVNHRIYPSPKELDPSNADELAAYMKTIPAGALILVLIGHFLGLLVGNYVGALIAKKDPKVIFTISGIFFLLAAYNLYSLPHPLWFTFSELAAILAATLIPLKLMKT